MQRRSCLALGLVALLSRPAAADLKSGDELFLRGDYPGAIRVYRAQTKGPDSDRAQVRLARALMRVGDLTLAESAAKAAVSSADLSVAADGKVVLAEIQRATGRYAEARKTLEALVAGHPDHQRGRVQLGLTYRDLGDEASPRRIWNGFFDDWSAGKIDKKDAEQLMYVAMAARYLEGFEDANDTFRDAVQADPNLLEANIEWGWLFLDKYSAGYAEQSFEEVLKVDPHHPDAHAGMARVKLEQNYDYRGADEHIKKALAQNPRHAAALAIRAEMEIDNGQYRDAKQTLAAILAVNSTDTTARAMLAAMAYLRGDKAGFLAEEQRVLALNPRCAHFYHIVADFAVKEHRYDQAIALEKEALKVDPTYHRSLEAIGAGYLRMGDEKNGLEYLNQAWTRDTFNVRTYNLLNLFDHVIPDDYTFISSKKLKLRVLKTEARVLERYVPRLLEKAFADMARRYGFSPRTPVQIELFGNTDHYSVRTMGLPNLGALGVCFGQVITAVSPSTGNLNWGMVLWHELAHVFAIQLSGARVPRWFTEGLSEYETVLARPEWRRENDVDVWLALDRKALPSVVELNARFLRARDMNDMVVAYHMSSLAVEFLATRWGFPKVVSALQLYGKGRSDEEVIVAITSLDVATFDREFREWLARRLAPYKGTFKIRLTDYADVTALEKTAAAKPDDASALADLALGHLAAQDGNRARDAAAKALSLEPRNLRALWAMAEAAHAAERWKEAKVKYEALIAAGGDGYDVRLRLGTLALKEDDLRQAETHLRRAKQLDPERSEPSMLLAHAYLKASREAEGLRELERYAMIEQMELGPVKELVDRYAAAKDWPKVREFGEMALLIHPFQAELHLSLGEAHLELKEPEQANFEHASALLCEPALRRPALAHIGLARGYLLQKKTKEARQALDLALGLEPQNAAALELKASISR